jgi:hypothetical protein
MGKLTDLVEQVLTESAGRSNGYFWKKGDQWLAWVPGKGNDRGTALSSEDYDSMKGFHNPKTISVAEEASDGFYLASVETGRGARLTLSNIKSTTPEKELKKIEKSEQKTKGTFTDMEAGGRGSQGKSFQGMVRGAQEASYYVRENKKKWLNEFKKAKKVSDLVVYDKNGLNWDTKSRHEFMRKEGLK